MARVYQCDRCGNIYPWGYIRHITTDGNAIQQMTYDICKECADDFYKFMKEKKEKEGMNDD